MISVPSVFQDCGALLPLDEGRMILFEGTPAEVLRGDAQQWDKLEDGLSRYRRASQADSACPPGALVGCFEYDGSFEFHVYETCREVEADLCWAGALHKSQKLEWMEQPAREEYLERVRRAKEYIRQGDIYQVNLARKIEARLEGFQPGAFFRVLWTLTEAPQSMFFRGEDRVLMSASPETFLEITGRRILTRPIKGTRPRHPDPDEDKRLLLELSMDPKEIAELVMITDLERNDLGRVCEYGTVEVTELVRRVSYSHVHHQLSTVEGWLREDVAPLKAVRECFPGGSITGAPKKRAMEIIAELEPFRRGAYTGAMGYLGFDGSCRLNIAIRTCEWRDGVLSFYVGSGITADSSPEMEFEETCHKARAMQEAVASYLATAEVRV